MKNTRSRSLETLGSLHKISSSLSRVSSPGPVPSIKLNNRTSAGHRQHYLKIKKRTESVSFIKRPSPSTSLSEICEKLPDWQRQLPVFQPPVPKTVLFRSLHPGLPKNCNNYQKLPKGFERCSNEVVKFTPNQSLARAFGYTPAVNKALHPLATTHVPRKRILRRAEPQSLDISTSRRMPSPSLNTSSTLMGNSVRFILWCFSCRQKYFLIFSSLWQNLSIFFLLRYLEVRDEQHFAVRVDFMLRFEICCKTFIF